jgi:hypothetical protein
VQRVEHVSKETSSANFRNGFIYSIVVHTHALTIAQGNVEVLTISKVD